MLLESAAAIEDKDLAGHKLRMNEEGNGGGDIGGFAGAMERSALDEVGFHFGWIAGHRDGAGRDGVDANFRGQRLRQTTREHDDACFGDAMGNVAGPGEQTADIGEVDDDAAAGLLQEGSGSLGAEKRRFQICVEGGVPGLFGGSFKFRVQEVGRAVHQDVEAAKEFGRIVEEALDFGDATQIGLQSNASTAEFFDLRDYFSSFGTRRTVVDDDVGTFLGKVESDGAAQAFRGTGNECDPASERIVLMSWR